DTWSVWAPAPWPGDVTALPPTSLQTCLQLGQLASPAELARGPGHTRFLSLSVCCGAAPCLTLSVPAVYVVEERRRDDTGESACLTACWTALCCCCLWDMLT
uniref:Cysteine-rich and transmembrane domain-containing protein 1 n=1 Tax=Geospiza parvula TaxID=87175 RepID=A0A8C3MJJ1_GEOPR